MSAVSCLSPPRKKNALIEQYKIKQSIKKDRKKKRTVPTNLRLKKEKEKCIKTQKEKKKDNILIE